MNKEGRVEDTIKSMGNPYVNATEEFIKFQQVTKLLDSLQTKKGINYGSADNGQQESWNKQGEIGAYFTVARKWDRLTKYIQDAIQNGYIDESMNVTAQGKDGEPIIETLADMAVYAVKWVQWIATQLDPKEFEEWVKRNEL